MLQKREMNAVQKLAADLMNNSQLAIFISLFDI